MDPVRNPFAPGAGSRPPELAGRGAILGEAKTAIERALMGRDCRSQMLLGLRGVGKTVLLNQIEELAEKSGHLTSFIEAPEDRDLAELLLPKINQTLHKLSFSEQAKARVHRATRALKSFAATFSMASVEATRRLDEGFFKVRFDRLTPKEREYVIAMAELP